MAELEIKKGDTFPPLRGLATEGPQDVTAESDTDTFTCPGHGYANDDIVVLADLEGGAPLVADADFYYVIGATRHTFQLSATSGGSAIDLTADLTAGTARKLLPLPNADSMRALLKSGEFLITGAGVTALDPPEVEGGQVFNWEYGWAAGDTANVGQYTPELEITWNSAATPPEVETVPNSANDLGELSVSVVVDNG